MHTTLSTITTDAVTRTAYSNYNLWKGQRYAMNVFGQIGYQGSGSRDALTENLDIEDDSKEKIRNVYAEGSPNVNIPFKGIFGYIDAALVWDYSYTRTSNTMEMGVGGGSKEAFWNTTVYEDEENVWENFSYSNKSYTDVGLDFSAMFPLLLTNLNQMGIGFNILFNNRYTFETKYYGSNTVNGSEIDFDVEGKRKNYMRETWFNSALLLQFMRMPYHVRFEITEPLLYAVAPRTRVFNSSGSQMKSNAPEKSVF